MTERIPVAGPWVTETEIAFATEAASTGWYGRAGHFVQQFEEAFAGYLGVKHAIAVPHCTSAIHLALAGLGIGPGDEVIVPEITWIASAAPVHYLGATAVFADIDPVTWCMAPESVRACISPRTKAIIPVGLYGLTPDMAALGAIAREHGLHIIEDAAQTVGSKFQGRLAGTLGNVGVFSFHGTKTMTTGEGGMFVTDDTALHDRVQIMRDHGRDRSNAHSFYNVEIGYKYRMSSLQAAFGLGQLQRIDELVGRKRQLFAWYKDRLAGIPGVRLNAEPPGYFNSYWMTTIILDPEYGLTSTDLRAAFDTRSIDVRPFFLPLSSLPAFEHNPRTSEAKERNAVAYSLSPRGLNLPSAMRLTEADVDRVCDALRGILGRNSR